MFPYVPASPLTRRAENYAYLRQLWELQEGHTEFKQETPEHTEQETSSSAGRPVSEQASLRLHHSGSESGSQGRRQQSKLARIFIPARLQKTRSLEDGSGDHHNGHSPCISPPLLSSPTSTAPGSETTTDTASTTASSVADPAKHIFRSCADALANPFSRLFELNPLLLNIPHPLLSEAHPGNRNLRVLDFGGIEENVYTQAISRLPHVEVSHFTEAQLFTSHPPYLPFDSNNFDVVTTRTLYKLLSNPLHSQNPEPASWVRQVHRVLKKGGSFEFLFFDSHLKHAGPLTREMEPFLYEELPPFCTCSSTRTESPCSCSSLAGPSNTDTMTGARFLELLSQEGFVTEKSTTLMFPLTLLSSIFTRDGQRLKDDAQSHHVSMTPLLVSLLKTIDEECKTSQTAWRCIIGYARKQ